MQVWVYRPMYGELAIVSTHQDLTPEEFAREWCDYYPSDFYFFAELVPL